MRKVRLLFACFMLMHSLFSSLHTRGQEMLGVAFSIYSGISSASLNPALLTGTRVYMDVNLLTGNVAMANDMIFFAPDNRTILKAIKLDTNVFNGPYYGGNRSYDYYRDGKNKYFSIAAKLIGPSIMIQADRHAFGLTTSTRSFHSGNHIPYSMPVIIYEGLYYKPYHGIERDDYDYSVTSMTWSEIGLSYAYNFYDLYSNRFTFGVTLKALAGYQGGYIDMRNANYVIIDDRSVDFKNIDADIAYALPVDYGEDLIINTSPLFKGYGAGMDIGLVYTKLKSTLVYERDEKICARPYNDYLFKVGISFLDLGSISFTKNTELHRFDNVSKEWIDFDTIEFRGIRGNMQTYSTGFYGDPDASLIGNELTVGLPAAVSLQFDYHLKQRVYLGGMWMHPLRFNARTLWRPAQLAFVPRYEHRMLGVSVPVSLFNYRDPRIGIAVRFFSLTMGTDRLGSLLGLSNFNGMDFYFSIRFNINKGACSSYRHGACTNRNFGNIY